MMLQLANSIAFYPPSAERRLDIAHLGGHMLRMFNQMRELVGPPFPVGQDQPDPPRTLFLFGGYSWRYRGFYAWKLSYTDGAFSTERVVRARETEAGWRYCFAGDDDAVDHATETLGSRLPDAGNYPEQGIDMEPFEVLRDVIRAQLFNAVGGPPQIAKVYRHMNTRFFAVQWGGTLTSKRRQRAEVEAPERPPGP
jgi:hypothetical protein